MEYLSLDAKVHVVDVSGHKSKVRGIVRQRGKMKSGDVSNCDQMAGFSLCHMSLSKRERKEVRRKGKGAGQIYSRWTGGTRVMNWRWKVRKEEQKE